MYGVIGTERMFFDEFCGEIEKGLIYGDDVVVGGPMSLELGTEDLRLFRGEGVFTLAAGDGALKFNPSKLGQKENVVFGRGGDTVDPRGVDFWDVPFGNRASVEKVVIYH